MSETKTKLELMVERKRSNFRAEVTGLLKGMIHSLLIASSQSA